MMKKILFILALLLAASCTKLSEIEGVDVPKNGITFRVADFEDESGVKSTVTTGLKFYWNEGDVIGVVPADGQSNQVNFKVENPGSEASVASFDGGSWNLKEGVKYIAYSPFDTVILSSTDKLDFSFEDQKPSGNNSTAHLGKFDLMYASATSESEGKCDFTFTHKCAVLRFQLQVVPNTEYTSIVIASDKTIPTSLTMGLSDGTISIGGGSQSLTFPLEEAVSDADGLLTVWLMAPPCDLSTSNMMVSVIEADGAMYSSSTVKMKNHKAGKAYNYSLAMSKVGLSLKIDGVEQKLNSLYDYYYASTTQTVPFDVVVSSDAGSIMTADVSPHSKKVTSSIQADGVHFTISQYGYYIAKIDGVKVCLFADEDEVVPSGVDIKTFPGVDPTGETEMTAAMQNAINSTAASGQTLILTEGKYLCRQLSFPSNADFYITKNATVVLDPSDKSVYDMDRFAAFFRAENKSNIKIRGLGVIDGRGTRLWQKYRDGARVKMIVFRYCSNLTFEGVHLKDCSRWNMHLYECSNITCRNLKVFNDVNKLNNDGIDPDCSNNVLIENCFVMVGDDSICIKNYFWNGWTSGEETLPTYDITVRNNVCISGGAGVLKTGWTMNGDSWNIYFLNNDVIDAGHYPIYISNLDSDTHGSGSLKTVHYENNNIEACRSYVIFRLENSLKDCHIKNCNYETLARNNDSRAKCTSISYFATCTVQNVYIAGSKVTQNSDWLTETKNIFLIYK